MTYSVVNTSSWTFDQIAKYGKELTAAFVKLSQTFPDDITPQGIFASLNKGEHQLWIVLDEDRFVSFILTKTHVIDATGKKVVTITSLAGEDGLASGPDIYETIEAWAIEQDADIGAVEGRLGWKRIAARYGYEPYAVIYRKHLRQADGR